MRVRKRLGGGRLVVRLFALVLIPTLAFGVLAFEHVNEQRVESSAAHEFVAGVKVRSQIAAVLAAAQVDRIRLQGLATADEVGASREVVAGLVGGDVLEAFRDNLVAFDQDMAVLHAGHGDLRLASGESLGDALGNVRLEILAQRELSAGGLATVDGIQEVFDRLDAVLRDALTSTQNHSLGSGGLRRSVALLGALTDVLASAGDATADLLQSLPLGNAQESAAYSAAANTHQTRVDAFLVQLDDPELSEFREIVEMLAPVPPDVIGIFAPDAGRVPPSERVELASAAVLNHLQYLDTLDRFSNEFHQRLVDEANEFASDAEREVNRTAVIAALAVGVSATLLVFVLFSSAVPLRRLTRRAADIGQGNLDVEPLELQGPRDIRSLTRTVNEMLSTLRIVDKQVGRLARGDISNQADERLPGAIGVSLRDSMERLSELTTQLHRSEQLALSIVAQAANAIWTIDDDGVILSANEAASVLTGVPSPEQIGRPIRNFISSVEGEGFIHAAAGEDTHVLVTSSSVGVGLEPITSVIAHDIAERARYERQLAHEASHDALTGLPNRSAVLAHLQALTECRDAGVAVLFLDLDGFKYVNDTRGHSAGDLVLAEVARRLEKQAQPNDMVARLGGDEFLIVIESAESVDSVVEYGYRLIREIEEPYSDGSNVFGLSASVGVGFSEPGLLVADMIRHADNAVYMAKERGRNRVEVFDAEMQATIEKMAELELALRDAVHAGELVVDLQPTLDLATGCFAGAEALVRWERPGVGVVLPGDFIPIAERSSLINDVQRWVLNESCARLAAWRDRDPHCSFKIAINVSGKHLIEGDLVGDVRRALALNGADPTMLELELQEAHLLGNLERATETLNQLRSQGVEVAVDNFGTGYSSLTYLSRLPVDLMKIDRSFITTAVESRYDAAVVEAALAIGQTLELGVIAAGVETEEQLDFVRSLGCGRAQGFLLARPMSADAAEETLFAASNRVDARIENADSSTGSPLADR